MTKIKKVSYMQKGGGLNWRSFLTSLSSWTSHIKNLMRGEIFFLAMISSIREKYLSISCYQSKQTNNMYSVSAAAPRHMEYNIILPRL